MSGKTAKKIRRVAFVLGTALPIRHAYRSMKKAYYRVPRKERHALLNAPRLKPWLRALSRVNSR